MSTVWVLWEQEWCVRFGNLNSDPVHAIPDNVVVWYLFDGSDSGNHWTTVVNILEQYSPDSFSVNSLKEIQHHFKNPSFGSWGRISKTVGIKTLCWEDGNIKRSKMAAILRPHTQKVFC